MRNVVKQPELQATVATLQAAIAAAGGGGTGAVGPQGEVGPVGPRGESFVMKGTLAAVADLPVSNNSQNDTYIIDSRTWVWNGTSWFDRGLVITNVYKSSDLVTFNFDGSVLPTVGKSRWYPPHGITLTSTYFSVETVGEDATVLQVNVNGVASGTTMTCVAGAYKSETITLTATVTANDYITVDILNGNTAKNVNVIIAYDYVVNVPVTSGIKGDKGDDGVSFVLKGTLAAIDDLPSTGNIQNDTYLINNHAWFWNGTAWIDGGVFGGGSGGSGVQVLDDSNYFLFTDTSDPANPVTTTDYRLVSIGDGSGTDGATFKDLKAYIDFINNTSIRSWNCVVGYFKKPGAVALPSDDIWITNTESNGFWFLCGALPEGSPDPMLTNNYNSVMNDSNISLKVTEIVSCDNSYNLVIKVDSTDNLYARGVLAIYADTDGVLPYDKALQGAWAIESFDPVTKIVSLSGNMDVTQAPFTATTLAPITGLNITARFNLTTFIQNTLMISGVCGNGDNEGGLCNLSFNIARVEVIAPSASLLLYSNIYFHARQFSIYPAGYVETWGDVVFGGGANIAMFNCNYMGWSDHYFGSLASCLINASRCSFSQKLNTATNTPTFYIQEASTVLFTAPSIGNLGLTWVPPVAKPGSVVAVGQNYGDL